MKKVKVKTAAKLKKMKAKRWRKGHSSDSNPEKKAHRLQAKNRFFNVNTGPSNLTVDALAKHNEAVADSDDDETMSAGDAMSQARSAGGRTFSTWATNWTDCTNTTFTRVHRYASSNSAMHKEILAVLAAVTEVIKSKEGKETETEYFAALMTALETMEGESTLAAVSYLLSLVIKRVPVSVLKVRFSEISKALLDTLAGHVNSEAPALLKSVIVCLTVVIRLQDQGQWNNASTLHVYNGLLAFITHPKPKVRKAAQQAVKVILKGSTFMVQGDSPPHHPAASATAKYCIQKIEESGASKENSGALHVLELLKSILGVFPQHSLKSTCETILRLMTLSNVMVTSVCMRTLHGMFVVNPKQTNLPAELNAQIITALYDYMPGENDVQPMGAWLAVMEKAHVNLAKLDGKLAISHFPRFFTTCMNCMKSERKEVTAATANTLKNLLREGVSPCLTQLSSNLKMTPTGGAVVHKMFTAVEGGLSYQCHAAWGLVLQVLGVCFEILGKEFHTVMSKCLLSMADLRDSHQFAYKAELDQAFGEAIRAMGPKCVLDAVPLQITGENDNYDFPRSWILPVLKQNIRNTELAFFTSYFLPLAAKLRSKSLEYAQAKQVVEAKTYDALQFQIWSLLPEFCNNPTDIKQSFMGIAKILGTALTDRQDLRPDVMSSLRKLINQNLENETNRAELGKFAKNYLPILFNLFTTETENEKDSSRLSVLETTKCYMQIADKELIASFFEKTYGKLGDKNVSALKRHALMDLSIAMVPYLNKDRLKRLYSQILTQLESEDKTIQKKSYRVLEEMCACKSEECKKFVKSSTASFQGALIQSLSSSGPASKAPRLRCLIHIFEQLESPEVEFLQAVVPEAILCTKEVGVKARQSAYNLIIVMANALIRWHPTSTKKEVVCQFFEFVMAGLAGKPHLVSTTVLALTRLILEFRGELSDDLLTTLVDNTCLIVRSKSREIVLSSLSLLKVLLAVIPVFTLAQHLKKIVDSLVAMKEDNKHHFRFKAKEIFGRLVRKFGYEMIISMTPESVHKMIKNIKKTQESAKKKKDKANKDEDDDESDEEDLTSAKAKPETIDDLLRDTDSEVEGDDDDVNKTKKDKKKTTKPQRKSLAWLKEGGDDYVDFLDPQVSKKVMATKPTSEGKKASVKHDFKMAPDGRLIIKDDSDDEAQKDTKSPAAEIDDIDELLDAMEGIHVKKRKRKITDVEIDDDEAPMKYKAGGSGIHRPIAVPGKKAEKPQDPGSEYKSKKARGDMKKKDKPDPYAYIPLQIKNLNKRKVKKNAGQFKNLVKGARKGAAKGQKMKNKNK